MGAAVYGWCANLVFHHLLHWVNDDLSRTAFWSVLFFLWAGAAIRMARGHGDEGSSVEEHERSVQAATRRAAVTAVVGVTIILAFWSYGRYRQWI
jgi:hypothetical protein